MGPYDRYRMQQFGAPAPHPIEGGGVAMVPYYGGEWAGGLPPATDVDSTAYPPIYGEGYPMPFYPPATGSGNYGEAQPLPWGPLYPSDYEQRPLKPGTGRVV